MVYRAYIPYFKAIGRYFKMGGFGGEEISPPGGEREGISENGQNSSSSKVLENIHIKFQDSLTKFRDFGIFGGKFPPRGTGVKFRNTEKGIR